MEAGSVVFDVPCHGPTLILYQLLSCFDPAKLRKLRPSFKENGGSGIASSISDGAVALVLVSGEKALKLGLQVIATVLDSVHCWPWQPKSQYQNHELCCITCC